MTRFLEWFNGELDVPAAIASAIAHLWFVSIHPFEDGNGRLARILGDIMLARGDESALRFYNITSEINRDKKHYYDVLERIQKGDGDITEWLMWYLNKLQSALDESSRLVNRILNKSYFWMRVASVSMSPRQVSTLNLFLDGYEVKITTKKWASLNKCSVDTAGRDIADLVNKGILIQEIPGAKRPSYVICYRGKFEIPDHLIDSATIQQDDHGDYYLVSTLRGVAVRECVQELDVERLNRGDTTMAIIVDKYCAYLLD